MTSLDDFPTIPVEPYHLVPVRPPARFVEFDSNRHGQPIYLWRVVTKVSTNGSTALRILAVTSAVVFLCKVNGSVSRVLRSCDIERLFVQQYREVLPKPANAQLVIKCVSSSQEPTLVLRLSPHPFNNEVRGMSDSTLQDGRRVPWDQDPLLPVRVLNEVQKIWTGVDCPVHQIPSETFDVMNNADSFKLFGSFSKLPGTLRPKKKLGLWTGSYPQPASQTESHKEREQVFPVMQVEEEYDLPQQLHSDAPQHVMGYGGAAYHPPPRPPPPPPRGPVDYPGFDEPVPPTVVASEQVLRVLRSHTPAMPRKRNAAASKEPSVVHLHLYLHQPADVARRWG